MTAPTAAKRKACDTELSPLGVTVYTKVPRSTTQHNASSSSVDSWTRVAAMCNSTASAGRGSLSGWTFCPLCGIYSKKKHALGRGIANHLKDIHTPWNPGKS